MGSEMCIRDSFDKVSRGIAGEGELGKDSELGSAGGGIAGELEDHCLLYTSDAADERSSVDLGGRRIIKKKNSKKQGGTQRQSESRSNRAGCE